MCRRDGRAAVAEDLGLKELRGALVEFVSQNDDGTPSPADIDFEVEPLDASTTRDSGPIVPFRQALVRM